MPVPGLRPATLLKKSLWHRCFPVNCAKFLRTPFFTENLGLLLLKYVMIQLLSQLQFQLRDLSNIHDGTGFFTHYKGKVKKIGEALIDDHWRVSKNILKISHFNYL